MSNGSARRRRLRALLAEVSAVAIGVIVAAVLATPRGGSISPFGLLSGVIVLVAVGGIVGSRVSTRWETIPLGSAAGAALVFGWAILIDRPQDALAFVRSGLSSGIALGVAVGAMFAGPGYLFGRAWRAGEGPAMERPEATPGAIPTRPGGSGPGARSYAGAGCLILIADALIIAWILNGLSHLGPLGAARAADRLGRDR